MKKIILSFTALIATLVTQAAGTKGMELVDVPEYIHKEGQNFGATIGLNGFGYAPEIPLPRITVLEGDYIFMRATSCSLNSYSGGPTCILNLEIAEASDFGERLHSHIRFRFEFEFDEYYDLDFWTVQPGLDIGGISPTSQNILYGDSAQRLTYSSDDRSNIRSLQWQQKEADGDWVDIRWAAGDSFSPHSLLQTTQFRVVATSKSGCLGYTEPVIVHVSPQLRPGKIAGNQTIDPGNIPTAVWNWSSAQGGAAPISYQWQSRRADTAWTDIAGATSAAYEPPALTSTTYLRRKATSGTETVYSNTVLIAVRAPLAEYLSFMPIENVVGEKDWDNRTRGLKTYEKAAVPGGDSTVAGYVERAFYYDYRGRIIQTVEKNHLGGISRYSSKYDFSGNVLKNHEQHTTHMGPIASDQSECESHQKLTEFIYDHRGRLLTEKTSLNDSDTATVNYTYDQLGRLCGKTYNSGKPWPEPVTLDRIKVGTNIRGWTFRRDRAGTSDVVNAPGFFLNPEGVVRLTATNGLEIAAYTEEEDWIWSSMTMRIGTDTRYLMDAGTWLDLDVPDYDTFTIPDDKDYIVTSNTLPVGDGVWGFDRIKKFEYNPNVITETYDYNIQGWQTAQQAVKEADTLFGTCMRYYDPQFAETTPSFTGNVSEWEWRHGGSGIAAPRTFTYAFAYDALARLLDTRQYIDDVRSDRFVERGLTYDRNGNILTLQRTANGSNSDSLAYSYTGNQLTSLSGTASGSYNYDANGNMTCDGANEVNISYNQLNLIDKVTRNSNILAKYAYLSDGTKLSATDAAGNGLYYLGSLVYRKQNGVFTLESAAFGSGRILAAAGSTGTIFTPHYFITDHLGSVRAIVDGSSGLISERSDYYPFGYRWQAQQSEVSDNRYRYNGKEEQAFVNVPYTDYGARMYDPRFGIRWNGVDPHFHEYMNIGPYVFCAGNPIKFIDPDGKKVYFSPGVSREFKIKFAETIKYMNSRGSAGNIALLEKSDKVYYIGENSSSGKKNRFVVNRDRNTIYWDPNVAYQTTEGIWISPATVLAHEAGHAAEYDTRPDEFVQNVKKLDNQYDNAEERRNITTTEQSAAKKHKEIKGETITRKNHKTVGKADVNNLTPYEIEEKFKKINEVFNNSHLFFDSL